MTLSTFSHWSLLLDILVFQSILISQTVFESMQASFENFFPLVYNSWSIFFICFTISSSSQMRTEHLSEFLLKVKSVARMSYLIPLSLRFNIGLASSRCIQTFLQCQNIFNLLLLNSVLNSLPQLLQIMVPLSRSLRKVRFHKEWGNCQNKLKLYCIFFLCIMEFLKVQILDT